MKLINSYIYAIGQKLPYKNREDIKKELESLIYDEIESKYGKEPTEEDMKQFINNFGTPKEVAKKYSNEPLVISSGLTDLYFMIIKIVVLAISIAFITAFTVGLFTKNYEGFELIIKTFIGIPLNIIQASLSGIGIVTLVFIIITKLANENNIETDDDWTIEDLNDISIENMIESKLESILSIFFLTLFIAIINIHPQLLTKVENTWGVLDRLLSHRIDLQVFRPYAVALSIVWLFEIVYHIIILNTGIKTKKLKLMNFITSILGVTVLILIVTNKALFIGEGLLGFRGIFTIVLAVSIIEVLIEVGKYIIGFAK